MKPTVKITNKRNEFKHYVIANGVSSPSNEVYLNDGQTFEIMMFNPTQKVLLAMIEINGKLISQSGLILKPGQRVFLERYLDSPEKFKFSTYSIEDSKEAKEAASQNGKIDVKFYEEPEVSPRINLNEIISTPYIPPFTPWPNSPSVPYQPNIFYCNSTFDDAKVVTDSFTTSTVSNYSSTVEYNSKPKTPINMGKKLFKQSKEVETGRVEKGEHSKQDFVFENRTFNTYPSFTESITLKPTSQKPVEVSEIRTYCTKCSHRRKKDSWEFCPNCGTKYTK